MQERTATVDGTPVRWLEQEGDGVPVVLLHGIPTSPAVWRHVVPRLAGRRVLAYELTGYGDSIPAGEGRDISVAAQADRLLAWLDELAVGPAVLVGHDLGGGVAHLAALRRPPSCAGLLLTNGVGYDSWPVPAARALAAVSPVLRRLPAAALLPVLAVLVVRGHDDRRRGVESLRVHRRPYAQHGGGAALARQVTSLRTSDTAGTSERLAGLRVPARVVWGVADPFQQARYGERFARDLGVTMRRIDGGRHFTPEDHPDVLADELHGLLVEVEAHPPGDV